MTIITDNRTLGEVVADGSPERRTSLEQQIQTRDADLSEQAFNPGHSAVPVAGGRLFAYACLFAVPAAILVLIAFGLPRGAAALLGGVLAAWVVSLLMADPRPQTADVRSARLASGGGAVMVGCAREITRGVCVPVLSRHPTSNSGRPRCSKRLLGVAIAGVAATTLLLRGFKQMRDRVPLRLLRWGFRATSGET